jgi:dienelactone hydrolase
MKKTLFLSHEKTLTNMKHKLLPLLFASLLSLSTASAQTDSTAYEVTGNMPVFYQQMKQQLTYPLAWGKAEEKDFAKWKAQARHVLAECMQNFQPAPKAYAMEVTDREQRDGYEARKIRFNLSEWSRVPAYLLVPEGKGPFPAIVLLHDHGAHFSIGKEKMVRPFHVAPEVMEDADQWASQCYDGQYVGDYLARHGYVVLAIDALFWGERGRKEGTSYDAQQALASNFLQMGASWGAFINVDDMRSAEFLASLPFVDKKRVGSLGFSMGAYRSWMLAALTDVVRASASICWMNTTEHLMTLTNNQNKGGSAYAMLIPALRRYLDYPHVASIACPKPTLFFNGTRDKLFPIEGVRDAYREMEAVWKSQGASDRLVTKLWDEKHFFNKEMQKETLEFFDRWLKP